MAAVLRSHVLGAWHTPSDEGRPLYDAVTGERGGPAVLRRASTSPPCSTTGAGSAAPRCAS